MEGKSGDINNGESGLVGGHIRYKIDHVLGNGSFGVVVEAHSSTGERVAIKKVYQDPYYKNRELDIMRQLRHPNIIELKDYFYSETSQKEKYLNLVMEYIPETVYLVIRSFASNRIIMPLKLVKLYTFQMCRSLGYLHAKGICHRDIKPQNLLVDTKTHVLKLCDFGSAKQIKPGDKSVSYICSRYYRAPELMLGATEYTTAIDIWSLGCVFGELILGKPLFAGETSIDQLVKVFQILGTPTAQQLSTMNQAYAEFKFPSLPKQSWENIMGHRCPDTLYDLLGQFLSYEPQSRLKPLDALAHPFFDEVHTYVNDQNKHSYIQPLSEFEINNMSSLPKNRIKTFYQNNTITDHEETQVTPTENGDATG